MSWKEIIPGDQYLVSVDGPFNEGDGKVLTFLYQPLIGPVCISLYLTLKNQVEDNNLSSAAVSHYYIMNLLDLNLPEIYAARQKLEAIGLMNTYVKKDEDDNRFFLYELKSPLSPNQFFSDGLLNIYLYQKIGRDYYQRLKKFFSDKILPLDGFEPITKEFQQVFTSSTSYPFYQQEELQTPGKLAQKTEAQPISVIPENFDFDLLVAGLNEAIVPKKAITQEVKDSILKLAFLYGIDPIQMKNIVIGSVTEDNRIDIEALRKGARDWYTIEHYSSLPKLIDRVQSPVYHANINVPNSQEERLIRYLETSSPRQLLVDLSEGSEPAASDLKLIEEIMMNQKLSPGVVNVLIQYCLLRTDMKLSKAFVEKIASHWARKKVKTVQEAMKLAKEENRKYLEWQQSKNEKKTVQRKSVRTEKVPDWFENRDKPIEKQEDLSNFEEEKRKLEERLRKYKKD